jgi:large subunit ribosomal protein L25
MDQEIHTKIPVELIGTAPAVKEQGGILMHHLNEVEIKCLPKDLVHSFSVNVESLVDFHSYVRVKDLEVPEGITILNGEEDLVATVVAPREEEAEVAEEAVELGAEGEEGADAGAEEGADAGADEKSE